MIGTTPPDGPKIYRVADGVDTAVPGDVAATRSEAAWRPSAPGPMPVGSGVVVPPPASPPQHPRTADTVAVQPPAPEKIMSSVGEPVRVDDSSDDGGVAARGADDEFTNTMALGPTRRRRRDRPVSVAVAVLRYPVLFLVIVVLVTGASVAVALARTPTTTAEVRLLIGKVDAEARAVPGFAAATEDLASIYARVVPTDAVLVPAAKAAGVPLAVARGAISASPIPGASIVRIEAKDPSEARGRAGRCCFEGTLRLRRAAEHGRSVLDPAVPGVRRARRPRSRRRRSSRRGSESVHPAAGAQHP